MTENKSGVIVGIIENGNQLLDRFRQFQRSNPGRRIMAAVLGVIGCYMDDMETNLYERIYLDLLRVNPTEAKQFRELIEAFLDAARAIDKLMPYDFKKAPRMTDHDVHVLVFKFSKTVTYSITYLEGLPLRLADRTGGNENGYPFGRILQREPRDDGPESPNLFWWQGRRVEFTPNSWRLLNFLWDKDQASREEVHEAVWGNSVLDATIKTALSRLNTECLNHKMPFIFHLKSGYVCKDI